MKKAIIVASFGTSYENALKNSIEVIEREIEENFKEYDIFRAFTSHKIIKKLKVTKNINILTPEEVLEKLYEDGYDEVIIQPLHIIPGEEYDYIKNIKKEFKEKFSSIKIGRPIFYYQGVEGVPDDYSLFIKSIDNILKENKNVILFGHGTAHPSASVYGCIQTVLEDEGYQNVFVGTVEGYPSLNNVLNRLKRKNIKEVLLMPLMVVAGDHVLNDMASEEEDSWKTILESEGIKVNLFMKGLGEIKEFRNLYIDRIEDVINDRYKKVGRTKKGIKNANTNNFVKL